MLSVNFHCCKWPNIEQTLKQSGHTAAADEYAKAALVTTTKKTSERIILQFKKFDWMMAGCHFAQQHFGK